MYRFGDGTPFPLRENFIETIVAAVDCCVALYQREAEAEAREEREQLTRKMAADELKRLDALRVLIETAVTPLLHRKDRPGRASQVAAQKIHDAAQQIIRQTRAGVVRRRDTVIQEAVAAPSDDGLLAALELFFLGHALPRTEWRLRWTASVEGGVVVDIGAQATRELDLAFDAHIPPDSEWTRPMPVAALLPGLPIPSTLELHGKRRAIDLVTFSVTEVHVAPGRVSLVLRESGKKASAGLHVVIPHSSDTAPLVVALDKHDHPKSHPFHLDAAGSAGIHALWAAIDARIPALLAARARIVSARLAGHEVSEIDRPAQLAEAILLALAPLLREMRMRSRVPGELILKRDLGGDRREEMFVPRKVLWAKLAALPSRHRQVFEAVGLSDEATSDFATRIGRRPTPPMPRRAIARGTVSSAPLDDGPSGVHESVITSPEAFQRGPESARGPESPRRPESARGPQAFQRGPEAPAASPDAFERGPDPLDEPLRPRPDTNGPAFDADADADGESTLPKSDRPTLVSGVIDAHRITRSRAQA